jgi:hypothetical protein
LGETGSEPPRTPVSSASTTKDLVDAEGEVEYIEFLGDPVRLDRLGDGGESVVEVPANDDLIRRLAILGGKISDDLVLQRVCRRDVVGL